MEEDIGDDVTMTSSRGSPRDVITLESPSAFTGRSVDELLRSVSVHDKNKTVKPCSRLSTVRG